MMVVVYTLVVVVVDVAGCMHATYGWA